MYFFKVVLSLFDEGKETIFIIPDTDALGKDELPELFDSVLTAHPAFTAFVKRTKASVVDVGYELYETKDVLEEISESDFELMQEQKMLKLLDSIEFCIQTRKIKQHKKKKGKSSLFPIIGIGAAALILIAGAVYKMTRSNEEPPPEPENEITSEITESSEGLENGLEELPIDDIISSVPEAVESTAENPPGYSEQDDEEQLPEDDEDTETAPINSSTPTEPEGSE